VLQLFPFAGYLAAVTSAVTLAMLAAAGEMRVRSGAVAVIVFLIAGYCQFFAGAPLISAMGLALQTLLAVALIVRWRLSG
jgi:hypothetical protein